MDLITGLYIAGSGLLSVFAVLLLLYGSMLVMGALAKWGQSSKAGPPAKE
jgi:Na+-transporting methylmalonyl-CoA/oxaloacetate decarboxylase gamma subunit